MLPTVSDSIARIRAIADALVAAHAPSLRPWRAAWIRRALILVPGRMVRSGRRRTLRVPATSRLAPQRE